MKKKCIQFQYCSLMIPRKTVSTKFINLSFPKMTAQNQLNTDSDNVKKSFISVYTAMVTRIYLLEHCRKNEK